MLYEEDINDYFDYCHPANFAKQYVLGRMIRFNTDFAENLHIDEDTLYDYHKTLQMIGK